jgi:hypothetical protein
MIFMFYAIFSGMNTSSESSMYVVNMLMKSRNIKNAKVEIKYVETLRAPIQLIRLQNCYLLERNGRATAQAVSRWLPTAAAQVRSRVWSSKICGGQSGVGAGFL